MADNTLLNSGTGGDTIRTEDRTTFKTPVSLIDVGGTSGESILGDAGVYMPVEGTVAHDAADDGNPVKIGGIAETALPTAVIDNDRVNATFTTTGGLLVAGADGTTPRNVAVNASGQLEVDISAQQGAALDVSGATVTVAGTGTLAVQEDGAALTALQLIDDVIFVDDTATHTAATTKVAGIGAVATPTDTVVDANDIGMVAMSLDRRLHVDSQIVGQDADITIADGGNVISTDWNGTAPPIGAGTEAAALRVTVATDSTGTLTVDGSGTFTVGGVAAHDAAVSGNPVLLAGEARTTTPTAVADGDTVRLQADDQGRLVTVANAPRDLVVQGNITLTSTTETTLIAAAASTFHDLTLLTLSNTSSTAVRVDIRDTTGGTVLLSMFLAADGGGAVIPFPTPKPQTTVNTNWTAQLSGAVTDVRIQAMAVKRV